VLDTVLGKLARQHDPNVLVGFDHADDAGVYLIAPDQALVQTVDFFTPIVDDPYTFGQIAATNALSDVYAMGGRPVTALALVCFPDKADIEILGRILAGGLSKMMEAGCTVIGGHSIRDEETKFGYSVTGLIDPRKIYANAGAKPGDALVLTKELGTGVISTAIKKGKAEQSWIDAAINSMTTLNKQASEVITGAGFKDAPMGMAALGRPAEQSSTAHSQAAPDAFPISTMTDVTGFGLIGHARELLLASDVSIKIHASKVPILEGALACIHAGHIPGGLTNNRNFAECLVEYTPDVPEDLRTILYDPQTAGGLLISTPNGEALIQALNAAGVPAARIGEVLPNTKPRVQVVR
jgi:selenide, water dikinase